MLNIFKILKGTTCPTKPSIKIIEIAKQKFPKDFDRLLIFTCSEFDNKFTVTISFVGKLNEFNFLEATPIASDANDLFPSESIYFFASLENSTESSGL